MAVSSSSNGQHLSLSTTQTQPLLLRVEPTRKRSRRRRTLRRWPFPAAVVLLSTLQLLRHSNNDHLLGDDDHNNNHEVNKGIRDRVLREFVDTKGAAAAINHSTRTTTKTNDDEQEESSSSLSPQQQPRGAACLMLKNDNALLYEWIAYHYHVLPLRVLVIGLDQGNRQDPRKVLQLWDKQARATRMEPLEYVILNASAFVVSQETENNNTTHRHSNNNPVLQAHHAFANRQRAFVRTCLQILQISHDKNDRNNNYYNVTWTLLTDSDEFVTFNTWNPQEAEEQDEAANTQQQQQFVQQRQRLLPPLSTATTTQTATTTILDFLQNHRDTWVLENGNRTACYTLPRLRFGALTNHTCREATSMNGHTNATSMLRTLQFLQHARKTNFEINRFGKVLVDVSQLNRTTTTTTTIRNIHRPFVNMCGPAAKPLTSSLLRVNHYLGLYEQHYQRDKDDRRSWDYWQSMAHQGAQQACGDVTHHWWRQFVQHDLAGNVDAALRLVQATN